MAARPVTLRVETRDALHAGLGQVVPPGVSPLLDLLGRERTLPVADLERQVGPAVVDQLVALRLAERAPDGATPRARLDRVGSLLVASDLHRHRRAPDFVVGPGPASFLLARMVRPHPGGRLLDLGCGSGIQGLLLAGARTEVVALDINPRAVVYAHFNAALNERPRVRAGAGDFLTAEPDRRLDRRFTTVVANPPFVLAPKADLVYRDRPLGGDDVGATTVDRVARALAPGGRGYLLCNWIDRGSTGWSGPARAWLADTGLDGAAVRIATLRPTAYAAVWTRDLAAAERPAATAAWAATLEAEGISRIHVAILAMARPERGRGHRFAALERPETSDEAWRTVERAFAGGPARRRGVAAWAARAIDGRGQSTAS